MTLSFKFTDIDTAKEAETIFVRAVCLNICEPLAKAFATMADTGLLTTRYQLYLDAVTAILDDHAVYFHPHNCDILKLMGDCWEHATCGK